MKKQKPFKPNDKSLRMFSASAIILSFLLFAAFAAASVFASSIRRSQSAATTDPLCTVTTPCTITLTAEYDRSPIDPHFISPSGNRYSAQTADSYSDDGNTIVMSVTTNEAGDWQLSYSKKNNRSLSLSVDQTYANQVYLLNVELEQSSLTGEVYLSFFPVYGNGTDTETKIPCSITLSSFDTQVSRLVFGQDVPLNTTSRVQLNMDDLSNGLYQIELITGNNANENYHAVWNGDLTWEGLKTVSNNTL